MYRRRPALVNHTQGSVEPGRLIGSAAALIFATIIGVLGGRLAAGVGQGAQLSQHRHARLCVIIYAD
jgi:hypothetical protein